MDLSLQILSDIIVHLKYARYDEKKQRRETWEEIVDRNKNMHIKNFPALKEEIEEAYKLVYEKKVLPSMRALQFSGKAIDINPLRSFNCSYLSIDRWESFQEIIFLLLCGCGVGISVQKHHVEQLPEVRGHIKRTRRFLVGDSIEGWADSIRVLMRSYFQGLSKPIFDFSAIREQGTPLKTTGGKAPGPQPLKNCIHHITGILDNKEVGEKLTPFECHSIACHLADCVLAGGIRRASLITFFSLSDEEMLSCKTGNWWEKNPHLGRSNNSVVLLRHKLTRKTFMKVWERIKEGGTGEPGIFLTNNKDMLANPCFTGDTLIATADGRGVVPIKQLAEEELDVPVYSVDPFTQQVSIKRARHPRLTGKQQKILKITFDDGSVLRTTPNHKFPLRDHGTKEAKDLQRGDSLLRFSKRPEKMSKNNKKEYLRIYCNLSDTHKDKIYEHRLIAQYYYPDEWHKIYNANKENGWIKGGIVVHHNNYNSIDNRPDNLKIITFKDHCILHSQQDKQGIKNGRYCGITNQEIETKVITHTKKIQRRMSVNEYSKLAKDNNLPQTFSNWRQEDWFKTPVELTKWAAKQCGISEQQTEIDPRTIRTYQKALQNGYTAEIINNTVYVDRVCEVCGCVLKTKWSRREQCVCSGKCTGQYLKTHYAAQRKESIRKHFATKQQETRDLQIKIYKNLCTTLQRNPLKTEWVKECKDQGISYRLTSTTKYSPNTVALKTYKQLKEAAELYNHTVISVEEDGYADVYNLTVDDNHTVATVLNHRDDGMCDGVFSFQCGEISLESRNVCNLTMINGTNVQDQADFNKRAEVSSFLGTLQASYTNFHYVSDKWKDNCEKYALLGCTITGIASGKLEDLDIPEAVEIIKQVNIETAAKIGINPAARLTSLKPSGTSSLLVASSSGIHAWFAPYYIRRIKVLKTEPIYAYLKKHIPQLLEDDFFKPSQEALVKIPVKAPERAITRDETAIDMLERVKKYNIEWIKPGHISGDNTHNISATVFIKDHEWDVVGKWMWENKKFYNGITTLPHDGGTYKQPPHEEITKEEYEELYKYLKEVDLTKIKEDEDNTVLKEQVACAGGACSIT